MSAETESPSSEDNPQGNDVQEASFDDLRRDKTKRREMRKRMLYQTVDGKIAEFEYRALTEAEKDEMATLIEGNINPQQAQNMDVGELVNSIGIDKARTHMITTAVTDGPDGFTLNSERHAEALPDELREQLGDAIEAFSRMDEETRVNFTS